MGNTNACCSVETAKGKNQLKLGGGGGNSATPTYQPNTPDVITPGVLNAKPSEHEIEAFRKRLEESIGILVVIADGKKIHCRLRWKPDDLTLLMTCNADNRVHVRQMALDEVLTVISGSRDLGRVATKAKIVDDPTCVALHLASNTCIPICLESAADKECFVHLIKQLKAASRSPRI